MNRCRKPQGNLLPGKTTWTDKINAMRVRAITALFFVIVLLASLLLGKYTFGLFFIVLSIWCLNEFYRLLKGSDAQPNRIMGSLLGLFAFGLYAAHYLFGLPQRYTLLSIPCIALVFIAELYRKQLKPFTGVAYTFLGLIYVVLPFAFFFALAFVTGSYTEQLPLGFMLILWGNDTGAYLVGKYTGRHKLFERVSPKKTWEGLAGGVLLALLIAWIISRYFMVLNGWQWAVVALTIAFFGTFGDLVESLFKRSQKIKDSGAILPGHGGLLDRFDGLLLAAPVVFVLLKLIL